MRFETQRVSAYIVRLLQAAETVRAVTVDGGDIIAFALVTGETVSLHLIDSDIALYEVRGIVSANTAAGVYTLFALWRDLLLPEHGQHIDPPDWMAALMRLHGGLIYGYDFDGTDIYLFPVYFDGPGPVFTARFGRTVDPALLGCRVVQTGEPLAGTWRVAGFSRNGAPPTTRPAFGLGAYYAALGLEPGATRAAVKRAYRRLARRYHPDVNAGSDANLRMQALNEAYHALLDTLDES